MSIKIDENTELEEITRDIAIKYAAMFQQGFHNGKSGDERKYFWPKEIPMSQEEKVAEFENHVKAAMDYLGFKVEGEVKWQTPK